MSAGGKLGRGLRQSTRDQGGIQARPAWTLVMLGTGCGAMTSPLSLTCRLGLVASLLLATVGCKTPRTTEEMRKDVLVAAAEGRFADAQAETNDLYGSNLANEPTEKGGSAEPTASVNDKQALIWRMERGMLAHLAGDLVLSNQLLDPAGDLVDVRRSKGLVTEAATYVANDTLRDFPGNAFEHTQVDYWRCLNRLVMAQRSQSLFTPRALTFVAGQPRAVGELKFDDGTGALENYDRAIIFARRLTINQLQETADAAGSNRYHDDPFGRLMAAITILAPPAEGRSGSDAQFADVMLKKALAGYAEQAKVLGGQKAFRYETSARPKLIDTLLVRHCRTYDRAGFDEKLKDYGYAPGDERLAAAELPKGSGSVLVLNHVGFITHPEVLDIRALAAQFRGTLEPTPEESARGVTSSRFHIGGILFWAKGPGSEIVNFWAPIPVPGELVRKIIAPGGASFMGFAIPVHIHDQPIATPASVRVHRADGSDEGRHQLEVVCDLDAYARATLKDDQPGVLAKTITRAVAKQVAAGALANEAKQRGGEGLGLIVNLLGSAAATFSEVADTRAWSSLPDHVEASLIDLPAGTYSLTLDSPYGPAELGPVTIAAGRTVVVPVRTLPQPAAHKP